MDRAAHKLKTRSSALFASRRLGAAMQSDAQHEASPAQAGGEQSSSLKFPGASGLSDAEPNGAPKPVLDRGALTLPKEISVARSTKWMGRCRLRALRGSTCRCARRPASAAVGSELAAVWLMVGELPANWQGAAYGWAGAPTGPGRHVLAEGSACCQYWGRAATHVAGGQHCPCCCLHLSFAVLSICISGLAKAGMLAASDTCPQQPVVCPGSGSCLCLVLPKCGLALQLPGSLNSTLNPKPPKACHRCSTLPDNRLLLAAAGSTSWRASETMWWSGSSASSCSSRSCGYRSTSSHTRTSPSCA